jgi:hypothetical protein
MPKTFSGGGITSTLEYSSGKTNAVRGEKNVTFVIIIKLLCNNMHG